MQKKIMISALVCVSLAGAYYFLQQFANSQYIDSPAENKNTEIANSKGGGVNLSTTNSSVASDSAQFKPSAEVVLDPSKTQGKIKENDSAEKPLSADYGQIEGVNPQANAQVASVAEALKNSKHPERLSPLIQPKPFDKAQFEKDPNAYLNVVEPGRVFQSLNPAAGVPIIQGLSAPFVTISQKTKTNLKVKAMAKMPVTFTSFDLGAFQNELTTITVLANQEGFAEATFTATEGTIADCHILASCPVTSGRVKFIVTITKENLFSKEN